MEKEIFLKIEEMKDILLKKIKTIEDYTNQKDILVSGLELIEKILKEMAVEFEDKNKQNIINSEEENNKKDELKEENTKINSEDIINNNIIKEDEKKNEILNEEIIKEQINEKEINIDLKEEELKQENKEENIKYNNEDNNKEKEIKEENNKDNEIKEISENIEQKEIDQKLNIEIQDDESNEKYSLPKLNFDYDKNINEILKDINIEDQNKPSLKISVDDKSTEDFTKNKSFTINNDIIKNISKRKDDFKKEEFPINYLIKNKKEKIISKEINNEEDNQLNNIKISNLQKNGYSDLFSFNQDLSNINNKSSFTADEFLTKKNQFNVNKKDEEININNHILNINTNNTLQSEDKIKNINNKNNITSISSIPENENNVKESKALRVANIIMKINSNDILYDIIIQLYSKDILNKLMSSNVDVNLINLIEQTIEKITVLENEEIEKLNNKKSIKENDNNTNGKNTEIKDHIKNQKSNIKMKNVNNFNKLKVTKKNNESNNHRSSFSFYDKSNISYYQLNPKIPQSKHLNRHKAEYLNSEILQNYPKTGKTILGYDKFKRDKNREFNFERSLRNGNYLDDFRNKQNYNHNISKADSFGRNQSNYSNNRSFSNKKVIFNNYTSPFGDYFDSSLQKGGQSKLKMDYPNPNDNILFKNCRSPVKDYIEGINDVYI